MKTHIYLVSPVTVNGKVFPKYGVYPFQEKVIKTHPCKNGECYVFYRVLIDDVAYDIEQEYAVAVTEKQSLEIRDPESIRRERDQDKVVDYIQTVKEALGIDMTLNYRAQHETQGISRYHLEEDNETRTLPSIPEAPL